MNYVIKLTESYSIGLIQGTCFNNNSEATIKSLLLEEKTLFSQAVSVKAIASIEQILFAARQTIEAIESENCFSSNPSMELLIHLSGERQVKNALKLLEINAGKKEGNETQECVLIAVGNDEKKVQAHLKKMASELNLKEDSCLIEKNFAKRKKELMKLYGISEKQLDLFEDKNQALKDLIIEHNAMVVFE